ncbi:hypothetical protein [Glacieibacterium sp.]|uniref:hypothetical protein n=1 Tax=Glacieibacterium sp. TaxID=2860237 RepID=UPI003AFFDADF
MSFGIGSFNPMQMVSQAALAMATGGTSLIAQVALQLATQVGKEILQQVGQQLGVPQPMIDAAQGGLDIAAGNPAGAAQEYSQAAQGSASLIADAGELFRQSPAQIGGAQRDVQSAVEDFIQNQILQGAQQGSDEDGNVRGIGAKGSSKGSWLMVLAEALGRQANAAADELASKSNSLDWKDPKQSSDFQALTQQFNMLMSAITNAIKSVGEGLTTAARKG